MACYNDIFLTDEMKKKIYNPILPSTFRALGWNVGQGTLQTLLQPVRLLCHSHRGPKSAYGGLTGFIQDGGYSREEPGRPLSHICPGPCAVFSCRCQSGVPLTPSSPDSPSRKSLFIELGRGVAKRVWISRWNVQTVT